MDAESIRATAEGKLKLLAQADCQWNTGDSTKPSEGTIFLRSAEWSPDGTCVITNSSDNCIRTLIIPPELLETRDRPLLLEPYSVIHSRESADALACYPNYNLSDTPTALILSTVNEHPIRLNSALTGDLVASYPLVDPNTEAYIKPKSLIFTVDSRCFIAGSESLISTFDLSYPGTEPLSSIKTGPRSRKSSWYNPALSLRGSISALAIDDQFHVLAAGSLSRQVALYDLAGRGECVGVFSVAGTDGDKAISGNGITQMAWSNCGRYLYVTERKSNGILIYDIRKSGQLLAWAVGRAAMTNQRMKVDLTFEGDGMHNLWAGSQDGSIRHWVDPHHHEGTVSPSETLEVHEGISNHS